MTASGVGHPDWQQYTNWRDTFVYDTTFMVNPGQNLAIGDFVTTNWASLILQMDAFPLGCTLEIEWFADAAGTEDVAADFFDVTTDCSLYGIIPVKGNLASISVFNPNLAQQNSSLYVQPTNTVVANFSAFNSPITDVILGMTLAHSTSVNLFTSNLVGGPCYVFFTPNDATGKLNMNLQALDVTKTSFALLANSVGPVAQVSMPLIVPVAPLRASVTNTDTVSSHTFSLSIVTQSQ